MSDQPIQPLNDAISITLEDGIAWIAFNRPEKRNAINPAIVWAMCDAFDQLEHDPRCKVVVLTGSGDSWSAGMDLKEYFRDTDGKPAERAKLFRANGDWQWRRLRTYAKPTIAMVNGWCFGGAFTPLICCDLAIAAEEARFGLSEVNWGIIPAGVVNRAVAQLLGERAGLYYVMTGETFDGKRAAEVGLVNEAVPLAELRERTRRLAMKLMEKNPATLRAAKTSYRLSVGMDWETAGDYLMAKMDQLSLQDPEDGRNAGMSQFLDDKTYKPGLQSYRREP